MALSWVVKRLCLCHGQPGISMSLYSEAGIWHFSSSKKEMQEMVIDINIILMCSFVIWTEKPALMVPFRL